MGGICGTNGSIVRWQMPGAYYFLVYTVFMTYTIKAVIIEVKGTRGLLRPTCIQWLQTMTPV